MACQFFRYRLYNFTTTTNGVDPSIDPAFIPQLQIVCPENGDSTRCIGLDNGNPNRFDTSFFTNLRNGRGILESNQKLWIDNASTKAFVQGFLGIKGLQALNFNLEFGRSMVKMSNISLKGNEGEIRKYSPQLTNGKIFK